jgi:hypothetical protein
MHIFIGWMLILYKKNQMIVFFEKINKNRMGMGARGRKKIWGRLSG